MIVDFHTHIFPPDVREYRSDFLTMDATFAELYSSPKARLASLDDLLRSMDESDVDVSVALGFAWRDRDDCRRHNDYLLEAAAGSGGRIVAFCTLPLAVGPEAVGREASRCIEGGARGFGELRPESVGADLTDPEMLAALAGAVGGDYPLLFHVSEPVGHAYPGKRGFALDAFYRFVESQPGLRVVGAHWGGGLPFYTPMPEVKEALTNVSFDTAATSLLYDSTISRSGIELVGVEKILFGSDFPLLSQVRSRRRIEQAGLEDEQVRLILGANACRLLGLE